MCSDALCGDSDDESNTSEKEELVPKLAARACHLPGNSWCEDFYQYHTNTNPVIGFFLHHPFHPVTRGERLILLIGTLALGFFCAELLSQFKNDHLAENPPDYDPETVDWVEKFEYEWVESGVLGAMFPLAVLQFVLGEILWKLQACACAVEGGCCYYDLGDNTIKCCQYLGNILAAMMVLFVAAMAWVLGDEACDGEESQGNGEECKFKSWDAFWSLYVWEYVTSFGLTFAIASVKFSGVIPFLLCDNAVLMKFFGGRRKELRDEEEDEDLDEESDKDSDKESTKL